ncbi:MAG TPA: endonuclease/exonuclease/phosphatase family protein [Planctomycetota bacterium]|nr:endonuclease/exonuclease/phosphatase family protein [Planctomycetota bacterium]
MTYNVHRCVGLDGRHAPQRIAEIIARQDPDIVALQELETGHPRTGSIDQAQVLSAILKADFHYHAARQRGEARFGNAIFSRLPMRKVQSAILPTLPQIPIQTRGALWVAIRVGREEVQIINTHLGLLHHERFLQAGALCSKDWLAHPVYQGQPRVLCGDFNATTASRVYRLFMEALQDARSLSPSPAGRTWPSFLPVFRYDHIFVCPRIRVRGVTVPKTPLTVLASDHLPLVADIEIREGTDAGALPAPGEALR